MNWDRRALPDSKLARMTQPRELRTDDYRPRSRGRGHDVWAMLTASMLGDLAAVTVAQEGCGAHRLRV